MPNLINPPPRTSALVVDRMHELIREGQWAVGSRIPAEPELVTQFGVGRNTIREAVRALEHSGLLAPRRGDGTYVSSRNVLVGALARCAPRPEALDLVSTRRALESEAAELAAQRATNDDIARFREILATTIAAHESGDAARYANADIEFHHTLVALSRNPLLIELYDGLGEVIRRHHEAITTPTLPIGFPVGHREVVDAIAVGDADAARSAVHTYLDEALRHLQ